MTRESNTDSITTDASCEKINIIILSTTGLNGLNETAEVTIFTNYSALSNKIKSHQVLLELKKSKGQNNLNQ